MECEAESFNCETCPVANAIDELNDENLLAWQIYHRIGTRFLMDAALIPAMFAHVTKDMPSDDVADLCDRLAIIHDLLCPAPVEHR